MAESSLVDEEYESLVKDYKNMVKHITIGQQKGYIDILTIEGDLLNVKLSSAGWVSYDISVNTHVYLVH